MYSEAWRLQRDFFWVANMSGINWKLIHERYYHLVDRVGSRSEFSDLVWEMQGELGTSHCYEFGGDYKPRRNYQVGLLGADLEYDDNIKVFWTSGTAFLTRNNIFKQLNGFDKKLFAHMEEIDYCWKGILCGYENWVIPKFFLQ